VAADERNTQVEKVRIQLVGQMLTSIDLSEHGTP
jgi:hypothetical protein